MFKNSAFYFIALLVLAVIAFWQSYFSKFLDSTTYTHLHAFSMLLWISMLITQAFLIRQQKFQLHITIGKYSYALVPVIVISLILLAHSQIDILDGEISPNRLYILFLQLSLLFIFILAYSLAIFYRKTPVLHARFMITTALTIIDPIVARLPVDLPSIPYSYQLYTFGLTDLIIIALIFAERKQKNGRLVFPAMLCVFVLFQYLNLNHTDNIVWIEFAHWFARL